MSNDDIIEEEYGPRDVVLLNYSQTPVQYNNVPKVWLTHPSSTKENPILVPFTQGEAVQKVVEPDFSEGDMPVPIEEGELVTDLSIIKPYELVPENVRYGVEIAGVTGEFIGDAEEIVVEALAFSEGTYVVEPTAQGKVMSKVTIKQPENLVPENIAAGVEVAGVVGTHVGGGGEIDFSDPNFQFFTYQIDVTNKQITLYSILYAVLYEITGSCDVNIPNKIGGLDVVIACM